MLLVLYLFGMHGTHTSLRLIKYILYPKFIFKKVLDTNDN